jgi:WW domain
MSKSEHSAYTAFNAVDELVAKPVLGSDGAAKWQDFAGKQSKRSASVAPTAPLKQTDRAAGFTSWKEERAHADKIRVEQGVAGNYTHFKKKSTDGTISAKERKRIENRLIGEDQEYFLPSTTFHGWKFDYVFTTKVSHGTGYYFDGMDSLKNLRGELTIDGPPTAGTGQIGDEQAITARKKMSAESAVNGDSSRPKKKKKHEKAATVTIVNDPNHPLEQVAAALARRQQTSQQLLPTGWEAAMDAGSGNAYYYNRTTGERTWVKPAVWSTATDPATGKPYYYNTATGETVWAKPADL